MEFLQTAEFKTTDSQKESRICSLSTLLPHWNIFSTFATRVSMCGCYHHVLAAFHPSDNNHWPRLQWGSACPVMVWWTPHSSSTHLTSHTSTLTWNSARPLNRHSRIWQPAARVEFLFHLWEKSSQARTSTDKQNVSVALYALHKLCLRTLVLLSYNLISQTASSFTRGSWRWI